MNRRELIKTLSLISASFVFSKRSLFAVTEQKNDIFDSIINQAIKNNWKNLHIGDIIGKIGFKLLGTPYEGGTLESNDGKEKCKVTFSGLDCVTFYETSLDLARIIQKEKYTFDDLIDEVKYTRYRNGILDGYTSRLHYTSDWIFDNTKKNVVKDITKELGGEKHTFNLNFMSTHPQYYPMLKDFPERIKKIKEIEQNISKEVFYLIPHNKIADIESKLQTGDVIALTSGVKGLDYAHTGLIYKQDDVAHFMHASSEFKKVKLDNALHKYVQYVDKKQSITVLRPINVR